MTELLDARQFTPAEVAQRLDVTEATRINVRLVAGNQDPEVVVRWLRDLIERALEAKRARDQAA